MKRPFLACTLLAALAMGSSACGGDDDDSGGGGGCAHVQLVCKDDSTVMIDCDQYDSAPASIKDCAGKAADCKAVQACLFGGAK